MSPRPKNPPPDRRREILDAALRLFAEKGFAAVTNAEIAKEAGVTAPALYYYFPSKEELFRAAVREHVRQFVPAIAGVTQVGSSESGWSEEQLASLLRKAIAFFAEEKSQMLLKIVLAEGPRRPEIRQVWIDQTAAVMGLLTPYLEAGVRSGRIRPVDPRLIFLLLQGPMMATIITRDLLKIPALQGLANDEIVNAVLNTTFAGLLADRGQAEGRTGAGRGGPTAK